MRRCSSTWPSARRTSPRSSPRPSTWAAAAWSRRSASRWRPTTRGSWAAGRATEIGDVSFSIRRYRDRFGCDVYLLADALDIPYGARVSPGAADFLVEAAAHVSYARAARLLARHGLRVRATTVMRCMRDAGSLCAEEDRSAAESLYGAGVVPEAELSAEEVCMEADGTWFSLQRRGEGGPRRAEVKAVCAYQGKEAAARRSCAGTPSTTPAS